MTPDTNYPEGSRARAFLTNVVQFAPNLREIIHEIKRDEMVAEPSVVLTIDDAQRAIEAFFRDSEFELLGQEWAQFLISRRDVVLDEAYGSELLDILQDWSFPDGRSRMDAHRAGHWESVIQLIKLPMDDLPDWTSNN
jgi:hypothetical protein